MMAVEKLRIGSRGSALALWQARYVRDRLRCLPGGPAAVEILVIKTSGDRIQDRALLEVGGKGLFVKEIQQALLDHEVDIAVHSLKDYPAANPPELTLACVPQRQDPRDALVLSEGRRMEDLPAAPKAGTGSLRRRFQLAAARPHWRIAGLRGNVDTRLRKVDRGELDAVVLAAAGLKRLGHEGRITRFFSLDEMVPAVGQGALAIECREDRPELLELLRRIEDPQARRETDAERRFLAGLGGSCTTPLGIHAQVQEGRVSLRGYLSSLDGGRQIREDIEGEASRAADLADDLLERFRSLGAQELLGGA
jgi:hydroxymethylbilane synthase